MSGCTEEHPTPDHFDRGTAFHEASHVIVAITLGFRVDRIELSPGGATSWIERPELADLLQVRLSAAAYYLAGMAGESRAEGSTSGVHGDFQNAVDMVCTDVPDAQSDDDDVKVAVFRELDRAAILMLGILDHRWADIKDLAARLMAEPGGLGHDDLACYVYRVSDPVTKEGGAG